jgi:hypothetical protein
VSINLSVGLSPNRRTVGEWLLLGVRDIIPATIVIAGIFAAAVIVYRAYEYRIPLEATRAKTEMTCNPDPIREPYCPEATRLMRGGQGKDSFEAFAQCESHKEAACASLMVPNDDSNRIDQVFGGGVAAAAAVLAVAYALFVATKNGLRPIDLTLRSVRSGRLIRTLKAKRLKFALYLRPFWADVIGASVELDLNTEVKTFGMHLIVIGDEENDTFKSSRRGVRLELLGDHWQSIVAELAVLAERIYLLPSARRGTAWETDLVTSDVAISRKTYVIIPGQDRSMPKDFVDGLQLLSGKGFFPPAPTQDDRLIPLIQTGT